jgi:integrase
MQGKRTRALDSRGRPVPGLYVRDRRFIAGYQCPRTNRWRMQTLTADTLTDARRERDSLIAGLRELRIAAPAAGTFADVFADYQDARALSPRTRAHERHLVNRHLAELKNRRVQTLTATELARLLRAMRDTYSAWTCVAVYRLLAGSLALAVRRGVLTRSPMDGLAPSERPKQRNAKRVAVLDAETLERLVDAGTTQRWRAALALAGYAGLRLGEIRALMWGDVDLDAGTVNVRRSMLPDGTPKAPKTEAGARTVPLLPALRRRLVEWKLRAPHKQPNELVIGTAEAKPVAERNLRRALDDAKTAAGLDATADRLSWHALRHSFASLLATDLALPATTLALLIGHADAGFTLRVYARDGREQAAVVEDVLARASGAGIGGVSVASTQEGHGGSADARWAWNRRTP